MPKVMTLDGLGAPKKPERCKCVFNPRTKRRMKLCFVGKNPKNRSGWAFVKGGC